MKIVIEKEINFSFQHSINHRVRVNKRKARMMPMKIYFSKENKKELNKLNDWCIFKSYLCAQFKVLLAFVPVNIPRNEKISLIHSWGAKKGGGGGLSALSNEKKCLELVDLLCHFAELFNAEKKRLRERTNGENHKVQNNNKNNVVADKAVKLFSSRNHLLTFHTRFLPQYQSVRCHKFLSRNCYRFQFNGDDIKINFNEFLSYFSNHRNLRI